MHEERDKRIEKENIRQKELEGKQYSSKYNIDIYI